MPTLNPPFVPIGGGGRTITIGGVEAPDGYHWEQNLLNNMPAGGTATSYPVGSNNSNFTAGRSNCLTAVYFKNPGNTGPGLNAINIFLGCITTGDDPPQPMVTLNSYGGILGTWSGDGLVQPFTAIIETIGGGESGGVYLSYTPPTGFIGYLWYTVTASYVNYVYVNGNMATNSVYEYRKMPISQSGYNTGGGTWHGSKRALAYPILIGYPTNPVEDFSAYPNFIIGENANFDGVDSLQLNIGRLDYFTSNKEAKLSSGNPVIMAMSPYADVTSNVEPSPEILYGEEVPHNGYSYRARDLIRVPPVYWCRSYVPTDSFKVAYDPRDGSMYPAMNIQWSQCNPTYPIDNWRAPAPTAMLKTTATITVRLERFPEPTPTILQVSPNAICYQNGATLYLYGYNLTGVNTSSIPGTTVTSDGDTQATLTIPAGIDVSQGVFVSAGDGPRARVQFYFRDLEDCLGGNPQIPNPPPYSPPLPPPPAPTPTPAANCKAQWNFGSITSDIAGIDGPYVTDYAGVVFLAPIVGSFELSAITNELSFIISQILAFNNSNLNPSVGDIIAISGWDRSGVNGYNANGSYYVIETSDIAGKRYLKLNCINTSITPTPSPIPSGNCAAPPNTNNGPLGFPLLPVLNEIYSFAGRAWFWTTFAWNRYCLPSVTPPPPPNTTPPIQFGAVVPTVEGYTVQINNYATAFTYIATVPLGTVTINTLGLVIVIGLPPSTLATTTITSTRTDYTTITIQVSGSSL